LESFECGAARFRIGIRRFDLQSLSDPLQVAEAGAFHREGLLSRLSGPVVTDQTVCALLQGLVCEVGFPLDHGSICFQLARGGKQRFSDFRFLRKRDGRDRQYAENDQYHTFHSVTSVYWPGTREQESRRLDAVYSPWPIL